MPLFGNKFSPAKCPARKKLAFHSENTNVDYKGPIKLKIGTQESVFVKGEWKPVSGGNIELYKKNELLQKLSKDLREENNMLKVKVDILLDLLTQEAYEVERRDKKIKKLEILANQSSGDHFS